MTPQVLACISLTLNFLVAVWLIYRTELKGLADNLAARWIARRAREINAVFERAEKRMSP